MNLVEELKVERAELVDAVRKLLHDTVEEAKHAIEHIGGCAPILTALVGAERVYYYPDFSDAWAKKESLRAIEEHLREKNVSASVLIFTARVGLTDGTEERALTAIAHTSDWKEMHAFAFREGPEGTQWAKPLVQKEFQSNMWSLPYHAQS